VLKEQFLLFFLAASLVLEVASGPFITLADIFFIFAGGVNFFICHLNFPAKNKILTIFSCFLKKITIFSRLPKKKKNFSQLTIVAQ